MAVPVVDRLQTPTPVVAHDDRDSTLPVGCCFDSTMDLHHPLWLIEVGVLDGVGDGLIDGQDDVLELTSWPGQSGKPTAQLVSGHRHCDRVRGQRQPQQPTRLPRGCGVADRAVPFRACWQLRRRGGVFGVTSRWHRARYRSGRLATWINPLVVPTVPTADHGSQGRCRAAAIGKERAAHPRRCETALEHRQARSPRSGG